MVLEDFYMISQVVAAFAVMGSLVFVGMQMRQSDKTQRAIMHQTRTERQIGIALGFVEPHNQSVLKKARENGRDLSRQDRQHLHRLLRVHLLSLEDIRWQHSVGLVEHDILKDQRFVTNSFLAIPAARALWKQSRGQFLAPFSDYVDDLISETPLALVSPETESEWAALFDSVMESGSGD